MGRLRCTGAAPFAALLGCLLVSMSQCGHFGSRLAELFSDRIWTDLLTTRAAWLLDTVARAALAAFVPIDDFATLRSILLIRLPSLRLVSRRI